MRPLLLALALASSPLALRAQEIGLPVGTKAPSAALVTLDGKPVDLSRWVGKGPVLIEFWATWCGNCKQLEPSLHRVAQRYAGKVALVGVAVGVNQSPERVRRYAAKHKLPLEVLYDVRGAASEAYQVPATSYVVVLDRTGKIVYTGQGGDQDLEAAVKRAL